MSRIEAAAKYCSAVEDRSIGQRLHQRRHRRRLRTPELQHLRRLRLDAEVERELAAVRGEQAPKHRTEGGAVPEVGVSFADHGQIGKRVEGLAVRAMRGPDEPPLLHVPQVIVAEVRVPLEQLTTRDRGRTGSHQDAPNIIQG